MWLTILTVERGDFLCIENVALVRPIFGHSFSNISSNAMMRNRKRTGSMMSLWLTSTLKGMEVTIILIISLTKLFLYITLNTEQKRAGDPYLARMEIISKWLGVSKYLTRSVNATEMGRLCLFCKCIRVFKVNLTSWHPNTGVYPNWYLAPCAFMILNDCLHMMLLNIFVPMSIKVMPRHLLVFDRSPIFGPGTIWTLCHSSKSVSSRHYLLKKSRRWVRLSSLISLKGFDGTFFGPGALFFVKFGTAAFISSHYMGWSIFCMTSLCITSYSADQSTGRSTQKTLEKCGPSTEDFWHW